MMTKRDKAEYGVERERRFQADCRCLAFDLGYGVEEKEGAIVLTKPGEPPRVLAKAGRRAWFDAWKTLKFGDVTSEEFAKAAGSKTDQS